MREVSENPEFIPYSKGMFSRANRGRKGKRLPEQDKFLGPGVMVLQDTDEHSAEFTC